MSALLKASRNDAIIARCLQTISQLMETNDLKSEEIQKGDKLLIVKMVS